MDKIHQMLKHRLPANEELGLSMLYAYAVENDKYPTFRHIYKSKIFGRPISGDYERRKAFVLRVKEEMYSSLYVDLHSTAFWTKYFLCIFNKVLHKDRVYNLQMYITTLNVRYLELYHKIKVNEKLMYTYEKLNRRKHET